MGRIWFWAGVVLVVLLCRHFTFWAVFGWAYAAASLVLIYVCFTHNRRRARELTAPDVARLRAQCLEMETNQ